MIGLVPRQFDLEFTRPGTHELFDLVQRDRAVEFRFAGAEKIEIGAVENGNPH
jgi:hypothetical protein